MEETKEEIGLDHYSYQKGIWSILRLAQQYPNDYDLGEHIRFLYNNYISTER